MNASSRPIQQVVLISSEPTADYFIFLHAPNEPNDQYVIPPPHVSVQVLCRQVSFNVVVQGGGDSRAAERKKIVHVGFVHESCEQVRREGEHVENQMLEVRQREVGA